jgi:hypothetical protein
LADPVIYAACLIAGLATYFVTGNVSDPARIMAVLPASFFILSHYSETVEDIRIHQDLLL